MPFLNPNYVQVPVRTIIKGVKLLTNGSLTSFEETYDFHEFKANISQSKHFQVKQNLKFYWLWLNNTQKNAPNRFEILKNFPFCFLCVVRFIQFLFIEMQNFFLSK
jgi:hypothetical protein